MSEQDMDRKQDEGPSKASACRGPVCPLAAMTWRPGGVLLTVAVVGALAVLLWPLLNSRSGDASAGVGDFSALSAKAPEDGIDWRTDYDAALAEAKKTGKPVLVDFTADWCPPCQMMKQQVWPRQPVRDAINANYIPLLLDVDRPETQSAQQKYDVRVIPTIVVIDGEGKALRKASYMDEAQMVEFLEAR